MEDPHRGQGGKEVRGRHEEDGRKVGMQEGDNTTSKRYEKDEKEGIMVGAGEGVRQDGRLSPARQSQRTSNGRQHITDSADIVDSK
jgi:hypothetical protein